MIKRRPLVRGTAIFLSLKHSCQVAALGKANVSSCRRLTPKLLRQNPVENLTLRETAYKATGNDVVHSLT